jgi:bacillithiol biosynthesis cysteine-adding enzyme BshC
MLVDGPLYSAYVGLAGLDAAGESNGGAADFYHYDPHGRDAAAQRASAVDREYDGDRAALAAVLQEAAAGLGGGAPARAAASRLALPGSLALVTGQQAGLLTGPLYTIYKAAGAIALARRMEAQLGRPVVPVFWAATEDHDLEEANQAWFAGPDGRWQALRCAVQPDRAGLSVGAIPLPAQAVRAVLDCLQALLPEGAGLDQVLDLAWSTAEHARTLGDWFCGLIQQLLGPLGMVVFDPMDPRLRSLAAGGVSRVLACNAALAESLARGARRVMEAGYDPQVPVDPRDAQLFMYAEGPEGPRRALERDGERGFVLRGGGGQRFSLEQLLDLAGKHPGRFSGNVVTRPILQDAVLPVLAYVAGPSETAYFGQYREAYEVMGMTMPLIWPRPSLTLVEPAVGRLMAKHGLGPGDVPSGLDAKREEILRACDPVGLDSLFARLKKDVDGAYAPVLPRLKALEAVLGHLAEENRGRVAREVGWLEGKARQALRQRAAAGLGQLSRIELALWPRRGPQERTANVLQYLARWGAGLVSELSDLQPGPPFTHQYAYLE